MLTCKQTSVLVSLSYDRHLSWREWLGVRMHLMICSACASFKRQMDFLRVAVRRFVQKQVDDDEQVRLSAEALERIARKIDHYQ